MTSLALFLWIAGGLLVQLGIWLGIRFWRHWMDYQRLGSSAQEGGATDQAPVIQQEQDSRLTDWSGLRTFRVERKVSEDAAQMTCSFYLAPLDGKPLAPFLPGQYLIFQLNLPSASGDLEPLTRCYSLSDAPRPDSYRVTIKRALAPSGSQARPGRSSNYFHDQVAVGSLLQLRAPSGLFHIDRSMAPVVLIGGGVGITPMLSMLNWCLTAQPGREVCLFYAVRNSREMVMQSELQALAATHPEFQLHLCFEAPLPEDLVGRDFQHQGRIDLALLRSQLALKPYHFYICGPTPMLESLVPALEDWGVSEDRIHYEAFGPASIRRKKSAEAHEGIGSGKAVEPAFAVTFARSRKQLPWQSANNSLLELAEGHGVTVSSGCRAGCCGTCQTTLLEGEVRYRQTPEFTPEAGTCLLCVCTPTTDVTLEL
jgi:ferredoxin-NADP reductase